MVSDGVMRFTMISGAVVPVCPDPDERPDVALTLERAVERSGMPAADLRRIWHVAWGRVFDDDEVTADDAVKTVVDPEPGVPRSPRLSLLRRVRYPDFSAEEFDWFVELCRVRRLNPFAMELLAEKRWDPVARRDAIEVITTIRAFRKIAARTGLWRGVTGPQWRGAEGDWVDLWTGTPDDENAPPYAARVGVIRDGFAEPVYRPVRWRDYVRTVIIDGKAQTDPFWARYGPDQLAKCAEAAAHRVAFHEELGDLYVREEMPPSPMRPGGGAGRILPTPQPRQVDRYDDDQRQPPELEEAALSQA